MAYRDFENSASALGFPHPAYSLRWQREVEGAFRKLEGLFLGKDLDIDQHRSLTIRSEGGLCLITFDSTVCTDLMAGGDGLIRMAKKVDALLRQSGVRCSALQVQEIHVERVDGFWIKGSLTQEEAKGTRQPRIERPVLTVMIPLDGATPVLNQAYACEIRNRAEHCSHTIKAAGDAITRSLANLDSLPPELCNELRKLALQTIRGTLSRKSSDMVLANE